MSDTGRIKKHLDLDMQALVFRPLEDEALAQELGYIAMVDQAHVLMLIDRGILPEKDGATLLKEITRLIAERFASLRGKAPIRGLYLLYENHLIEKTGDRIGGMLQAGRSRNDLGATISRIRARKPLRACVESGLTLIETLGAKSREFASVVMPAYTHYQPAMPVTLGHYLDSIAQALLRDVDGLLQASSSLECSPLGAGACGGTSFPIAPEETAALLGFTSVAANSIDAVASRDHVLRLLAAAAILGLTISRCASDLMLWSTYEFGFIHLPDELIGSSSMMPQKRNPFLLEHVKGRSGSPLACLQHAAMATHAAPYGNSVAVGTESVRGFEEAMEEVRSCLLILQKHIALMEPRAARMEEVAKAANTAATFVAEMLVRDAGMSFRDAHHQVGAKILEAEKIGVNGAVHAAQSLLTLEPESRSTMASPGLAMSAARYGAGPGREPSSENSIGDRCTAQRQLLEARMTPWRTAETTLSDRITKLLEKHGHLQAA
ncbi:argininosuccinate lyase [Trinickia fusca]|uniref:argininosuccinate lyase n=1 Tax=Trinickia fusca TaxID=2419777 RepID=A0A494XUA9_9BURK|nr:argininosuccinate lyase [Trinickia fusca]RKP52546.1 argininosuccinate lyase [Trinickia fusca]